MDIAHIFIHFIVQYMQHTVKRCEFLLFYYNSNKTAKQYKTNDQK